MYLVIRLMQSIFTDAAKRKTEAQEINQRI
jgi:hypothetical protein